MDDHLLFRTYLAQERVSTCDIAVMCDLMLGFEHAFDDAYLNNFINLKRWFNTMANQENVKAVIGNGKFLANF